MFQDRVLRTEGSSYKLKVGGTLLVYGDMQLSKSHMRFATHE